MVRRILLFARARARYISTCRPLAFAAQYDSIQIDSL